MDELDAVIDRFSFAPRYFSAGFRKRLARDLFQAKIAYSSDDYLSLSFGLALISSVFSLALLSLSLDYLPLSILVFVLVFFSMTRYPAIKKRRLARTIDKELPNSLRMVGIELGMGLPFETSLRDVCSASALGREMKHVLKSIENGSSVQEAFTAFSNRIDSNFARRASAQMIAAYEKGGSGETLKKLADEQESVLRARLKEYHGKLTVYSLLFIAASAVFPAIFQAFVIVGSSFLNIDFSPAQALLVPVLLFPAINAALFTLIRWKRP
jgi:pilus assembly protein TadC